MTGTRTSVAVMLAPLTGPLLFAVFIVVVGTVGGDPLGTLDLLNVTLVAAIYSYAGSLLIGLPLALLLQRAGKLQIIWIGLAGGFLCGVFVYLVHSFLTPDPAWDSVFRLIVYIVLFGPLGGATGLSFGLLAGLPWWRAKG